MNDGGIGYKTGSKSNKDNVKLLVKYYQENKPEDFSIFLKLNSIPSFFYKNAIAIMFPYVRAFISTLTLQANTKLLNLGLMNLSSLEKPLIENTIEL